MLKNKILKTGTAMGIVVVAGLSSAPAFAAGTLANTDIVNEVTVSYQVSGIAQADEEASNTVKVDRKVDLTVDRTDDTATSVTPGGTERAVTFQFVNLSNDTLDFDLEATQVTTGDPAGITGNDAFDVVDIAIYRDDGDGVYDSGDTLVTFLDAQAPDATVILHVLADSIPLELNNNLRAAITLKATAHASDNGTALGSALVEAVTNTAGVDTIFADAAGVDDGTRDAMHSDTDDFVVLTATLTATKSSTIVDGDFGTGAAIPGATIQYCITVTNASGGAAATNLVISDELPAEVTYDEDYTVRVGGATCGAPGPEDSGEESGGVVSGEIANLPAGTSQTLVFQAVIN
jgi:uncharacterized repeat protein (TIGR01451 family)